MRSTDETYYNIKRLHVVFAISSLALLAATIWMLAVDHRRPWKEYQRTFHDRIEPWLTAVRIQSQQTEAFEATETDLREKLSAARQAVADEALLAGFREALEADAASRQVDPPDFSAMEANDDRQSTIRALNTFLARAKLRQENLRRDLRFRRADFDEARSRFEAAVARELSAEQLDTRQKAVDAVADDVAALAARFEQAGDHCDVLASILAEITRAETDAARALAEHRAVVDRLQAALTNQRPGAGKDMLRWPVVDAFGGPPRVRQIWLPELTIDYNFRQVGRIDRCVTCHLGVDRTAPGSTAEPALPRQDTLSLRLTPGQQSSDAGGETLDSAYGIILAEEGMIDPEAVTVAVVLPETTAAKAGLRTGDVLVKIDDEPVTDTGQAETALLQCAKEKKTAALEIERGVPQPYCSHPRPDLYVGSTSPHPKSEFGCTICHDGQGSATAFRWASHTPDNPPEKLRWRKELDWSANPHWDFPMRPARFAQSSCLKCHHQVLDLDRSDHFPEAPAPKLVAGFDLIRGNGCFGCHEIRGTDDQGQTVGPDLRPAPPYAEAASRLLSADLAPVGHMTEAGRELARRILAEPENPRPRRELVAALRAAPRLPAPLAAMVDLLAAEETVPGTLHKIGPSLAGLADRLDVSAVADRIRRPTRLRADAKMPQVFDMHEHLAGRSLADAQRFEPVELRAMAEYLLWISRPAASLEPPPDVTEPASAERGEKLFIRHGCLACHQHNDFPESQATQGPNLSTIVVKYTAENRRPWLAGWIRDPASHSRWTPMPSVQLQPQPLAQDELEDEPPTSPVRMTDPAADIAAFLLKPAAADADALSIPEAPNPPDEDVFELARQYLSKAISGKAAAQYIEQGIPAAVAKEARADVELLAGRTTDENRRAKAMRYIGARAIGKRGCFGCHDVPGFETATPVGPALTAWGRKQESLLAFEQVGRFIGETEGDIDEADPDRGFFLDALRQGRREGFLWQKLRAPRSFDYQKAQNKPYNQRLVMGKFAIDDPQREAIMTFVLGLVAEPPAEKYVVRQPDANQIAQAEGRRLFEQNACTQCHTMQRERWDVAFDPEDFEYENAPPEFADFEFLRPEISEAALAESLATDAGGRRHATLVGRPVMDPEEPGSGRLYEYDYDDDDNPLYMFTPWEPAAINGWIWPVGGQSMVIGAPEIVAKHAPVGGEFARLLYPVVVAESDNPALAEQAWGWVPPELVDRGKTVHRQWLADYLLTATVIRPAAVLRMPDYRFSAAQARHLADYVTVATGGEVPPGPETVDRVAQLADEQRQLAILAEKELARPGRLDDAMRLVADRELYCAKCHLIGDFSPGGAVVTTLAPRLDQVARRIRPEYLRRWLGNPTTVLPYTGMPVNFPPTGDPLGQNLFSGSSAEQLDAVADLLLHYDWYTSHKAVGRLIEPSPEAQP